MSTIGNYELEAIAMPMHNPPHPGVFLRQHCPKPLGSTESNALKGLTVSRKTLTIPMN